MRGTSRPSVAASRLQRAALCSQLSATHTQQRLKTNRRVKRDSAFHTTLKPRPHSSTETIPLWLRAVQSLQRSHSEVKYNPLYPMFEHGAHPKHKNQSRKERRVVCIFSNEVLRDQDISGLPFERFGTTHPILRIVLRVNENTRRKFAETNNEQNVISRFLIFRSGLKNKRKFKEESSKHHEKDHHTCMTMRRHSLLPENPTDAGQPIRGTEALSPHWDAAADCWVCEWEVNQQLVRRIFFVEDGYRSAKAKAQADLLCKAVTSAARRYNDIIMRLTRIDLTAAREPSKNESVSTGGGVTSQAAGPGERCIWIHDFGVGGVSATEWLAKLCELENLLRYGHFIWEQDGLADSHSP